MTLSPGEEQRLSALDECKILDTPPDQRFEDVVDAVQGYLGVPIAYISLLDSRRQWFKASRGVGFMETPIEVAFCAYTILGEVPFIIPDTLLDPRFKNHAFVTGAPFVRFYLGLPVIAPSGVVVGALCAIDTAPRFPRNSQVSIMSLLARQVSSLLLLNQLQCHLELELGSTNALRRAA
jgi:adenylate cyclase